MVTYKKLISLIFLFACSGVAKANPVQIISPIPLPTYNVNPWVIQVGTISYIGYQTILDSGTPLPQEPNLNMSGSVVCVDSPTLSETVCTFSAMGASWGSIGGTISNQTDLWSYLSQIGPLNTSTAAIAGNLSSFESAVNLSTNSLQNQINGLGTTYLTNSSATVTYMPQTSSNTFLSTTTAASAYLTQSSATATYLQLSSATANYLTQSSAANTYFPISSSGTLLTTSSATAVYLSKNDASNTYLSQSSATTTYLQITSSGSFLSTSSATANYLSLSSATANYLSLSSASSTYFPITSSTTFLSVSSATNTYFPLSSSGTLVHYSGATGFVNLGSYGVSGSSVSVTTATVSQFICASSTQSYSGNIATFTWTNGMHQNVTLSPNTGNATTFYFTSIPSEVITFLITQDGSGSRTVTWPAQMWFPGGTASGAPTLTTTAGASDLVGFLCDGTKCVYTGSQLNVKY